MRKFWGKRAAVLPVQAPVVEETVVESQKKLWEGSFAT